MACTRCEGCAAARRGCADFGRSGVEYGAIKPPAAAALIGFGVSAAQGLRRCGEAF